MKKIYLLAAGCLVAGSAFAQSKLTAYSRAVIDDLKTEKSVSALKTIDGEKYLDAFIGIESVKNLKELEEMGVKIGVVTDKYITAQIPVSAIEKVQNSDNVRSIEISRKARLHLDTARNTTNHNKSLEGEAFGVAYDGTGVIYGTLDCGIDFNHANFRNSDGTTRIIAAYLPSNSSGEAVLGRVVDLNTGEMIANRTLPGSQFTTDVAVKRLTTDYQNESHGTHTIGIGAGSLSSTYKGYAPKADIIACGSGDLSATNIINTVAYIFDKATERNQPAVVNLSLGYNLGAHDGTNAEAYMIDKLVGPGKIVCLSAGNEGDQYLHVDHTFAANDTAYTFVTPPYGNNLEVQLDTWTRGTGSLGVKFSVVDKKTGKTVYKTTNECNAQNQTVTASQTPGFSSYFSGAIQMYYYEAESQRKDVFVNINGTLLSSNYGLRMELIGSEGETVDAWTDGYGTYFYDRGIAGYLDGSSTMSINTMACGYNTVSVGAYSSRSSTPSIEGGTVSYNTTVGQIIYFSSYGPTVDGRTLPQIIAPGAPVVSSYSNYDSANKPSSAYYRYVSKNERKFGRDNLYGGMQGTSMSCPVVSGIIATWLQADPTLEQKDIMDVFNKTAVKDSFTPAADADKWGYGKIDSYNGLIEILKMSSVGAIYDQKPIVMYPNPSDGAFKFYAAGETEVTVEAYNLNGGKVAEQQCNCIDGAVEVDFTSLSKGIYMIKATGEGTSYSGKLVVK